MKNYVIGTLAVIILVLSSLLYKESRTPVTPTFPLVETSKKIDVEVPFFLYVFFKKNNCRDCMEFIEVLNELPAHFIVTGIVPENELKEEIELREITGAKFHLISSKKFKKNIPWYTPTTIGVSPNGDLVFTLPGVPGEKEYLKTFLESLYGKLYPIWLEEKISKAKKK